MQNYGDHEDIRKAFTCSRVRPAGDNEDEAVNPQLGKQNESCFDWMAIYKVVSFITQGIQDECGCLLLEIWYGGLIR